MKKFKRAFLIDDDEIFIFAAKKIIEGSDFCEELEIFHNGQEALEKVLSIKGNPDAWPQVIFLDLNMPILDGWQFLDELVKIEAANKTRVFVVTSSINPDDLNKASEYSEIDKYIVKPITKSDLRTILEET